MVSAPIAIRKNDIVLASFPKSGSTWLRFFFANLYAIETGTSRAIDFTNIDALMPEVGRSNLFRADWVAGFPRMLKTHYRATIYLRRANALHLVRDPLETLKSYYRFRLRVRALNFSGSWDEFLLHKRFGFPAWLSHYNSWASSKAITVQYEDLLASPDDQVTSLLEALGVKAGRANIAEALRRCSRSEMKQLELQRGHAKQYALLAGRRFMEDAPVQASVEARDTPADLLQVRRLCRELLPEGMRARFPYRDRYLDPA